jgi:hypothetical protein
MKEVNNMSNYHDYTGVIHIHSTYSDGLKDLPSIIKAAKKARCNYMIITDHNTLKALPDEGWYGSTIVLVGEEITAGQDQGHYLAMRLTSEVHPHNSPQDIINNTISQNGIGFISHPFFDTTKRWIFGITPVTWKNWKVTGFNGMEIWNYSVDWIENFKCLLAYPLGLIFPNRFIDGPPDAALKKWDELLRYQKVVGLGNVDAHGYFCSYKRIFKTLHTHLLLKKALSYKSLFFKKDKNMIYKALEMGNCYLSYDYLASASGFMFSADNGQLQVIMGDELGILGIGVSLKISSPKPGLLRIIKDSQIIASATDARTLVKTITEPGAYRAEVYLNTSKGIKKNYQPWIYSNPIYIL